MTEKDILDLIQKDKWMMDILRAAESLDLPDWWIGAGFIRSKVWDHLSNYKKRTPLPDVDLIYFDSSEKNPEKSEKEHEDKLIKLFPEIKWQVKNQSRMHIYHKRKPYNNSSEALSEWTETATCVGVHLKQGKLELVAPHGITDLTSLVLRSIPGYKEKYKFDLGLFDRRGKEKKWLEKWPKLKILTD